MNAQKEAEYIAEIVMLKSELRKLVGNRPVQKINSILRFINDNDSGFIYEIVKPKRSTIANSLSRPSHTTISRPAPFLLVYKEEHTYIEAKYLD